MPDLPSEALLAVDLAFDHFEATFETREEWIAREPERALLGLGRRLQKLERRNQELVRMKAIFDDEVEASRRAVIDEMRQIDAAICAEVERRREASKGEEKSLSLPTIGTWSSRTVAGGWELPKDSEIIPVLSEADRALYVVEVKSEKVDREALRQGLDAAVETLLDTGTESYHPDEALVRAEVGQSYGVTYRQPRVSVRGPFTP